MSYADSLDPPAAGMAFPDRKCEVAGCGITNRSAGGDGNVVVVHGHQLCVGHWAAYEDETFNPKNNEKRLAVWLAKRAA